MKRLFVLIAAIAVAPFVLSADEGMWLPSEIHARISDMQNKGLKLTAEDLYSINSSSLKDGIVQFGGGCTGELISPEGLLITNHHCGYAQIQSHSSVEHDYLTNGFWAMTREEELPNEGLTVRFLVRMEDVTASVLKGYKDSMDEQRRNSVITKNADRLISKAEKEGPGYVAEVLPAYYGNKYYMYVYQEFSDVRLVGAPASSIGKFGGDTDNWMWPRHTGDFSIFRIYADKNNNPAPYSKDNVPYRPKRFFNISLKGVHENDFTFVYGYPGRTYEYILSDEVDYIANLSNPHKIALRTMRLDIQKAAMAESADIRIRYASKNAGIANAWKKWQGEMKGVRKLGTVDSKRSLEKGFSEWAADKPEYRGVVDTMKSILSAAREYKFAADYYSEAVFAVEAVKFAGRYVSMDETKGEKYAESFFKDYYEPIDRDIFKAVMSEFVKNIDSRFYPEYFKGLLEKHNGNINEIADWLFDNSVFTDREKFSQASAETKLKDVMVSYCLAFSDFAAKNISSVVKNSTMRLNLLYRTYMRGLMEYDTLRPYYPDANFTLRIAYGKVSGYSPADAVYYLPSSTLEGIMQKDNPEIYDYNIPQTLRDVYAARDYGRWESDGTVPVCFIATNHTTGGNSGSPVIDAEGNLIGINFDRVWEGTMSDIVFDPELCRNIALDVRYALFVIDKVAGASHLIDEMVLVE